MIEKKYHERSECLLKPTAKCAVMQTSFARALRGDPALSTGSCISVNHAPVLHACETHLKAREYMAIYRCSVSTISRSAGQSAVASVAYRSGEKLYDDRNDKSHDYSKRKGVVDTVLVLPSHAPNWSQDRGKLWNGAEAAEKRKNSVVAREVLVSLPHELSETQRKEATMTFAHDLSDRYGVAVDVAIHRPDRQGDQRNHHAHLMMTTRRLTANGFSEKTRELDDRKSGEIDKIRESWESHCNLALEKAGKDMRVDRRSLEARGIQQLPEPKIGAKATSMHRKNKETHAVLECHAIQAVNANLKKARKTLQEKQQHETAQQGHDHTYQRKQKYRGLMQEAKQIKAEAQPTLAQKLTGKAKSMREWAHRKLNGVRYEWQSFKQVQLHEKNTLRSAQEADRASLKHQQVNSVAKIKKALKSHYRGEKEWEGVAILREHREKRKEKLREIQQRQQKRERERERDRGMDFGL